MSGQLPEAESLQENKFMIKKIFPAILAVMILFVAASCKGEEEPAAPTFNINLLEYEIIYPNDAGDTLTSNIIDFSKRLTTTAGVRIGVSKDWLLDGSTPDDPAVNAANEILVGDTNRNQSAAAKTEITDQGYIIKVDGEKIVIAGSNDALLYEALDYFISICTSTDGRLTLNEKYSFETGAGNLLEIVSGGQTQFKIIRADGASDDVIEEAKSVVRALKDITGVSFTIGNDWVKKGDNPDSDDYEILIGETNRSESKRFISGLGFAGYGLKVDGKKIVVTGATDATLSYAVDLFVSMIEDNIILTSDGSCSLSLPVNTYKIGRFNNADFPGYDGGKLGGIYDCEDGVYEFYITDTDSAGYATYRSKLAGAGFTLGSENSIAGNLFASYTKDDVLIYAYFVQYLGSVRIIREPIKEIVPAPSAYTKVTESSITQLSLRYTEGDNGMGYIVTLEDGSYFIVDGGYKDDADSLYSFLSKNNKRPDGKIVIAAWLITHSHNDHYSCFDRFAQRYGGKVNLEYLLFNHFSASAGPTDGDYSDYLLTGYKLALAYFPGVKVIKPHTGYRIPIRNAVLEVLYTHEDLYPKTLEKLNNASLVSRLEIAGQTIMFLADAQYDASDVVCAIYGNYLKSDIVQIAHHGGLGGTKEIYRLIDPAVALWPSSKTIYESESVAREVDIYLLNQLHLKEVLIAFGENRTLILPYTPK